MEKYRKKLRQGPVKDINDGSLGPSFVYRGDIVPTTALGRQTQLVGITIMGRKMLTGGGLTLP